MKPAPFYTAIPTVGGEWGFKTPTGRCEGFFDKASAQRTAEITENQDREESKIGKGPIAAVLRKHFASEPQLETASA